MSPLKQLPSSIHHINISKLRDGEENNQRAKNNNAWLKNNAVPHATIAPRVNCFPFMQVQGTLKDIPVPKTRDNLKNWSMKYSLLGEPQWLGKQAADRQVVCVKGNMGSGKSWLKGVCVQEGNSLIGNITRAINLDLWLPLMERGNSH